MPVRTIPCMEEKPTQNKTRQRSISIIVYFVLKESVHCSKRTEYSIYFVRINDMSLKFESSPRPIPLVFQLHCLFLQVFSLWIFLLNE